MSDLQPFDFPKIPEAEEIIFNKNLEIDRLRARVHRLENVIYKLGLEAETAIDLMVIKVQDEIVFIPQEERERILSLDLIDSVAICEEFERKRLENA
jgi:hypothetical protein